MKNLLITGGSGEIGKAIIDDFVNLGFNIISPSSKLLDCSLDKSINNFFHGLKVTKIDVFIHCAGINITKPYYDVSDEDFMKTFMVNSLSFFKIIKKINSLFIDNVSKICAISSLYGSISRQKRITYTTSKHAINGMVKNLSIELAERGILVNSVSPGFIGTNMTYKNNNDNQIKDFESKIPLGFLGKPEYVASVVTFVCSENNKYLTGQDIIVDGGYSIGGFQKNI